MVKIFTWVISYPAVFVKNTVLSEIKKTFIYLLEICSGEDITSESILFYNVLEVEGFSLPSTSLQLKTEVQKLNLLNALTSRRFWRITAMV